MGIEMEFQSTSIPCTGLNMSRSGMLMAINPRFNNLIDDSAIDSLVLIAFKTKRKSGRIIRIFEDNGIKFLALHFEKLMPEGPV